MAAVTPSTTALTCFADPNRCTAIRSRKPPYHPSTPATGCGEVRRTARQTRAASYTVSSGTTVLETRQTRCLLGRGERRAGGKGNGRDVTITGCAIRFTASVRAPAEEQVGSTGATLVKAAFERLGWGVAVNPEHDLGPICSS
jgi:hypothetical protein